jgi:TRAP-type C4-dicarboxylate transport system substrate-binding protein
MKLPVYSRADLSRTVALVVALSLTAVSTGASAREFRAADIRNENDPTVQAPSYMGRLIAEKSGGRHQIRVFHSRQLGEETETIEQTRAGAIDLQSLAKAQRDPAAAELIERIRKVE